MSNSKTIGIVGGGQLARMMGQEIRRYNLPYELVVLDPTYKCPAYDFSKEQIIGNFDDEKKIIELAKRSDIMTFEIELADNKTLTELANNGLIIHPDPETLGIIKDKYKQYQFLIKNNLPIAETIEILELKNIKNELLSYGFLDFPIMIKKRIGSYDGRGNFLLQDLDDTSSIEKKLGLTGLIAQKFVDYQCEISVIATRSTTGNIKAYEVGENIHIDNILETTIVPARISPKIRTDAKELAYETLKALSGAGVFGIEMFVDKRNNLYINEISPRVHNSGHHTIESSVTSQFYQHLLAISGENLGSTDMKTRYAVMQNIIATGPMDSFSVIGANANDYGNNVSIHLYEKHSLSNSPRKMGHITVTSDNGSKKIPELITYAKHIREQIKFKEISKIK